MFNWLLAGNIDLLTFKCIIIVAVAMVRDALKTTGAVVNCELYKNYKSGLVRSDFGSL